MRINQSFQFQIINRIDGNQLKIISPGGDFASVLLDPSFILDRLPVLHEGSGQGLTARDWSLINVEDRGVTIAKSISISKLQLVIDREEVVRGWATVNAASEGRIGIVTSLLASGSISEYYRDIAAATAAEHGHAEIVTSLLAGGPISEEDRVSATGSALSQEGLDNAVSSAARNGHLPIVQLFLSEGRSLSQEGLDNAVSSAASHGHLPVVQFLLSEGRSLRPSDRTMLIIFTSYRGQKDILEFALQQGPIPRDVRDNAIMQARGDLAGEISDMLRMAPLLPDLVPGDPLPADQDYIPLYRDLMAAHQHGGYAGIVTYLLESGLIPEEHRG